jgi:hypothetical protein
MLTSGPTVSSEIRGSEIRGVNHLPDNRLKSADDGFAAGCRDASIEGIAADARDERPANEVVDEVTHAVWDGVFNLLFRVVNDHVVIWDHDKVIDEDIAEAVSEVTQEDIAKDNSEDLAEDAEEDRSADSEQDSDLDRALDNDEDADKDFRKDSEKDADKDLERDLAKDIEEDLARGPQKWLDIGPGGRRRGCGEWRIPNDEWRVGDRRREENTGKEPKCA